MTHTTPRTFDCPAGLRSIPNGTGLWIRSPRTGATITISEEWFSYLPSRVVGRVSQAVSLGRHVVTFTRDELLAIVRLNQGILSDSPYRIRSLRRAG